MIVLAGNGNAIVIINSDDNKTKVTSNLMIILRTKSRNQTKRRNSEEIYTHF